MKTHGHRLKKATPTYNSWRAMIQRCHYPRHPFYALYGGRGITVCARWRKFANFLEDMGERPDGMTLDRKDVEDIYWPGNCRWATKSQQRWNRRDMAAAAELLARYELPRLAEDVQSDQAEPW